MVRIAVTGGLACGKSLVGSFLAEEGVPVCEADDLAHELMRKGEPVHQRVVEAFGDGILDADGSIDRKKLGARVFANERDLAVLNSLVHPAVIEQWGVWLEGLGPDERMAAVVIPLLYEVGLEADWDAVICVSAPMDRRRAWLQDRGLSGEGIRQRLDAQLAMKPKMDQADYVIFNGGSKDDLRRQTFRVWERLCANMETRTGKT